MVLGESFQCIYLDLSFLEKNFEDNIVNIILFQCIHFPPHPPWTSNICMVDLPAYFPLHLLSLAHFTSLSHFISPYFFPLLSFSALYYILFEFFLFWASCNLVFIFEVIFFPSLFFLSPILILFVPFSPIVVLVFVFEIQCRFLKKYISKCLCEDFYCSFVCSNTVFFCFVPGCLEETSYQQKIFYIF